MNIKLVFNTKILPVLLILIMLLPACAPQVTAAKPKDVLGSQKPLVMAPKTVTEEPTEPFVTPPVADICGEISLDEALPCKDGVVFQEGILTHSGELIAVKIWMEKIHTHIEIHHLAVRIVAGEEFPFSCITGDDSITPVEIVPLPTEPKDIGVFCKTGALTGKDVYGHIPYHGPYFAEPTPTQTATPTLVPTSTATPLLSDTPGPTATLEPTVTSTETMTLTPEPTATEQATTPKTCPDEHQTVDYVITTEARVECVLGVIDNNPPASTARFRFDGGYLDVTLYRLGGNKRFAIGFVSGSSGNEAVCEIVGTPISNSRPTPTLIPWVEDISEAFAGHISNEDVAVMTCTYGSVTITAHGWLNQ